MYNYNVIIMKYILYYTILYCTFWEREVLILYTLKFVLKDSYLLKVDPDQSAIDNFYKNFHNPFDG